MIATSPKSVLALVLLAACARAEVPAPSEDTPPQNAATVDGVSYTADTRVQETFPVTLRTEATVTNAAAERRTIEMPGGCPVTLRAYRDAERAGPAVWDQSKVIVCTMQLAIIELAPGESERFETSASAVDILGDSLPPGRYYLTAVLRPDARVVEVPAGSAVLDR